MISVKNKKEELQDKWLQKSKIKITNEVINKNESKITIADVEDCLVLVISSFSNQTSYENQTKKAITNKGILKKKN